MNSCHECVDRTIEGSRITALTNPNSSSKDYFSFGIRFENSVAHVLMPADLENEMGCSTLALFCTRSLPLVGIFCNLSQKIKSGDY